LEKKHQNFPKMPYQNSPTTIKPHASTNDNQLSGKLIAMSFISLS